jgi:hypothetical protein
MNRLTRHLSDLFNLFKLCVDFSVKTAHYIQYNLKIAYSNAIISLLLVGGLALISPKISLSLIVGISFLSSIMLTFFYLIGDRDKVKTLTVDIGLSYLLSISYLCSGYFFQDLGAPYSFFMYYPQIMMVYVFVLLITGYIGENKSHRNGFGDVLFMAVVTGFMQWNNEAFVYSVVWAFAFKSAARLALYKILYRPNQHNKINPVIHMLFSDVHEEMKYRTK